MLATNYTGMLDFYDGGGSFVASTLPAVYSVRDGRNSILNIPLDSPLQDEADRTP